jgi:hypothetical protein
MNHRSSWPFGPGASGSRPPSHRRPHRPILRRRHQRPANGGPVTVAENPERALDDPDEFPQRDGRRAELVFGPHDGDRTDEMEVMLVDVDDDGVRVDSRGLYELTHSEWGGRRLLPPVEGRVFHVYVWDGGFNHAGDRLLAHQGRHDVSSAALIMQQVQGRHRARPASDA